MALRLLDRAVMKMLFPAGTSRQSELNHALLLIAAIGGLAGCSKADVNLAAQPSPQPRVIVQETPKQKTAADRLVEIDQLLAAPLTGRPEESDRRTALRAEREALIASGQVPFRYAPPSVTSRVANPPPSNNVTRTANGNVVQYAAPQRRTEPITVAPNSQTSNLSFLEQMTPSERERYYKAVRVQNTQRVEVDVRHH